MTHALGIAHRGASVFVTGGAGYIGSHTCVELLQAGYAVTVYDNFSNSRTESLACVQRISGKSLQVVQGDIRDIQALSAALGSSGAQAVIHFAGLKSVGESVEQPLRYYDNNLVGSLRLLEAMQQCGVRRLVFSSSATVYGQPQRLPLTEDHPLSATNPYGSTKLHIENLLRDLQRSQPDWRIGILRYFNPVGAHASGLIGEDPLGTPNNLMPRIAQVAIGLREQLDIWGADYDTPDGTGIRDYIHVVDLARGHIRALEYLQQHAECLTVNLGTGCGYSVLDLLRAFEQASGRAVPYRIGPRRQGDVATCYADPSRARDLLGWQAALSLEQMCADSWRWHSQQAEISGSG